MQVKNRILTAKFTGAEELVSAIKALIENGYKVVEVHSPHPLEGIAPIGRRESPVRFWSFIGGIIGLAAGFGLTIWMSLDWPHFTGGKPIVSLPPFLIIAFELTLLLGAIGTIIGFAFHSRLPSLNGKSRLTGDQFGLTLIEKSDKIKSIEYLLSSLGALDISVDDWNGTLLKHLLKPTPARVGKPVGGGFIRPATTDVINVAPTINQAPTILKSRLAFLIISILGIISFLIGISGAGAQRAWQIYLVNLLYWTGISLGGVLFTAILITVRAGWAKGLKTIAVRFFPFLLLSPVLFLMTFFGRHEIFPWIGNGIGNKEKWLNIPSLYLRDGLGWIGITILSIIFVYNSRKHHDDKGPFLAGLAVILIIVFMFFFSLIGIDLIMGLSPEWVSTLFGGYFAIGAFYNGLAFIMLWTLVFRVKIDDSERTDMGKLIFGFSLFWASLFWAQYLVIWYGNIPEETGFVYRRLNVFPWKGLSWTVIVLNFFIPFLLLLGRHAKANRGILFAASTSITVGFFLERFILIAPSISAKPYFGIIEFFISIGFLGVFLLCTRYTFCENP